MRLTRTTLPLILFGLGVLLLGAGPASAKDLPGICLTAAPTSGATTTDMVVTGKCTVHAGKAYHFRYVYVLDGGELTFEDGTIDFWASAIIIEKGGKLIAGSPTKPIGTANIKNVITIHLWGAPQSSGGKGVPCKSDLVDTCGAPAFIWSSNMNSDGTLVDPTPASNKTKTIAEVCKDKTGADKKACDDYTGPKDDYFYGYHPLFHDEGTHTAYFGYKVLAVSYGGTLQLFGKKGACTGAKCSDASYTGSSWVRLKGTATPVKEGETQTLTVETPDGGLGWQDGDEIVVTTTDYLPSHSEQRTISGTPKDNGNGTTTITVTQKLQYVHNGVTYPLSSVPDGVLDADLKKNGADVRAAVGLLSRNIRIVSAGCEDGEELPDAGKTCKTNGTTADAYFGGHVVVRQGFTTFQVSGVEFKQLGQGGRLGHYPIHFHHARRAQRPSPNTTMVLDSSINESMTRWVVLHGTSDVVLSRNVGWKSIGHGFYLEDGTEINNQLTGNLGVFARGAVEGPQNPRNVPGILVAPNQIDQVKEIVPFRSDADHPTVFWIMNGWNDFYYNFAAGAGTCGMCYWLVPGANSTVSRHPNYGASGAQTNGPRWTSYASEQSSLDRAAMTPLKAFVGNVCTTAMMSFNTIGNTDPCFGVVTSDPSGFPVLKPIKNDLAPPVNTVGPDTETPAQKSVRLRLDYYPSVDQGGGRFATQCNADDCSVTPKRCTSGADTEANCRITHIDRYTSSFTWAPFNFAALWLRPQWYLVSNSVIADVQNGGLNFVTGGGYSDSDRINGHWALVRKSVFIGQTQPDTNGFALDGGPFNLTSKLRCDTHPTGHQRPGDRCTSAADGVVFSMSNFGFSQRFFSVYDGPAFQESNAYLRIKTRTIDDCNPFQDAFNKAGFCDPPKKDPYINSAWLSGTVSGLPKGADNKCYMPNAAIGWKQPNGFYYPPAFHSANLFFNDVDIRHFVIEPLFKPDGTTDIDRKGTCNGPPDNNVTCFPAGQVKDEYCNYNEKLFDGFTDIDRQTVLNDDDGSLTGYKNTISVNLDEFFSSPVEAVECASDNTARTSPYEYVTTVVYPGCATLPASDPNQCAPPDEKGYSHKNDWDTPCSAPGCYGIPLYRQDLLKSDKGTARSVRMLGQNIGQRSSLTVNNGTFYVDTTVGKQKQNDYLPCKTGHGDTCALSVFKKNSTYYLFLIYAKSTTRQTYQIYVGKGQSANWATSTDNVWMTQADIARKPIVLSPKKLDVPVAWNPTYNPSTGILTITIDLSAVGTVGTKTLADLFKEARKANCKPGTYCTWDPDGNKGAGACNDLFASEAGASADSVCRWAIADIDCPSGGCFGIGFKTADTFKNSDEETSPAPPAGTNLMCSNTKFKVALQKVSAGTCPREGPFGKEDNRLELDFTDVVATHGKTGDCQDTTARPYSATDDFPHCKCPGDLEP